VPLRILIISRFSVAGIEQTLHTWRSQRLETLRLSPVPEFIDPVFGKTGSTISGTGGLFPLQGFFSPWPVRLLVFGGSSLTLCGPVVSGGRPSMSATLSAQLVALASPSCPRQGPMQSMLAKQGRRHLASGGHPALHPALAGYQPPWPPAVSGLRWLHGGRRSAFQVFRPALPPVRGLSPSLCGHQSPA
jgi:hypothetical protein